jgi:hypothetical protein
MADDDSKLQKQDLLLKMLNMTTSDNDGVALVAIRKANGLLTSSGWTWEKLLAGKITIVEDPFKSNSTFDSMLKKAAEPKPSSYSPPPPPNPFEPQAPRYTSNPIDAMDAALGRAGRASARAAAPRNSNPPTPKSMGLSEISTRSNNYANPCYFCGDHVESQAGYIFRPSDFNSKAPNKWCPVCISCNTSRIVLGTNVPTVAAPRTGKTAGLRNTTANLNLL